MQICVYNFFLRPKKDGSHRLILNLKQLNKSIEKVHSKLDSLKAAIFLLKKKDCYFASLDIRDAYYSIPVDESCKTFFSDFVSKTNCWNFQDYPKGIETLPVFSPKCKTSTSQAQRGRSYTVDLF